MREEWAGGEDCPAIGRPCQFFSWQDDRNGEVAITHCCHEDNPDTREGNTTRELCPFGEEYVRKEDLWERYRRENNAARPMESYLLQEDRMLAKDTTDPYYTQGLYPAILAGLSFVCGVLLTMAFHWWRK